MRLNKFIKLLLAFIIFLFSACQKFISVAPPVTSITSTSAYASDATAAAVLTGIYTDISGTLSTSVNKFRFLSLYAGLSADEFTLWTNITDNQGLLYYTNALISSPNLTVGGDFWSSLYPYIFTCNSAVEGLNQPATLTPAVRKQLLGEAKFMRALFYFYLVNLYGDVPLALGSDYEVNRKLPRSPSAEVYKQIILDLQSADSLLSPEYLDGSLLSTTSERVRPTQAAATALLARVYLYMGDWVNAEASATAVISNPAYSLETDLNSVFLSNNNEAIWQLQPVIFGDNTEEARIFIIPPTGPSDDFYTNPVYLSKNQLAAFEPNDNRRVNWVDSSIVSNDTFYYPYKYKVNAIGSPVTEYLTVLRLAEQYLIRAEARTQQNEIIGAQIDINAIRSRAGLQNTIASDQSSLLTAILHERQVELFTEWGHRWLDLKRAGTVNSVMSIVTPQKGGTWNTNWQWYPLPYSDLQNAPQLKQNSGY